MCTFLLQDAHVSSRGNLRKIADTKLRFPLRNMWTNVFSAFLRRRGVEKCPRSCLLSCADWPVLKIYFAQFRGFFFSEFPPSQQKSERGKRHVLYLEPIPTFSNVCQTLLGSFGMYQRHRQAVTVFKKPSTVVYVHHGKVLARDFLKVGTAWGVGGHLVGFGRFAAFFSA